MSKHISKEGSSSRLILVKFKDLGGIEYFSTRTLEVLLLKKGIILDKKNGEGEEKMGE